MTNVFETQTVIADPNAAPIVNVNLNKNFDVLEAAIITNIVKPSGVREITLGIVYDDAVTDQHSLSLETITVGNNLADIDIAMADTMNMQFVEFIDHTLSGDTVSVTVLSISKVIVENTRIVSQKFQLDPSNPISTGIPLVGVTASIVESHLTNVGSIAKPSNVGAGTLNSVYISITIP